MNENLLVSAAVVALFVLIGGFFAAAEIALVSLREGQIRRLERDGGKHARTAALARNPNRFLASVQIGVTVAGFLSAAFGASAIAPSVAPALESVGLPPAAAATTALISTTLVIAYLSLILGELVPKRIALQRSSGVALFATPFLDHFASAMRPIIWLLSRSTDLAVRLLGADPHTGSETTTRDELREMLRGHPALAEPERRILTDVFAASRRSLAEIMKPRTRVDFLRADATLEYAREYVLRHTHSRYPVTGRSTDDIIGFVHVRDVLGTDEPEIRTVEQLCRDILHLPACKTTFAALTDMQRGNHQIALVADEYGGTAGIVTFEDIVEEIVGDIGDEYDTPQQMCPHPRPPAREVDGALIIEDFQRETGIELPDGPYETAAGFLLHQLQRIPEPGESVPCGKYCLTVTELDGRRISRIRVTTHPAE